MAVVLTPLLVLHSEANIAAGEGAISNEVSLNLAEGLAITISKIVMELVPQLSVAVTGAQTLVQELDLDADNTAANAFLSDVETTRTSRIARQHVSGVSDTTAGDHTSFSVANPLVLDFSNLPIGERPRTTRNLRHHVTEDVVSGQGISWAASIMVYYNMVSLSRDELVSQVLAERSL